jgi:hypothetical protein
MKVELCDGKNSLAIELGMNLTMMCDFTNDGTTFEAWVMQRHLKIGIICLDKLLQCDHGRDVAIKVGFLMTISTQN